MAQPHLDLLQQLVDSLGVKMGDLSCKHFFSGAAVYVNGKICASLTPNGLAFKLSESRCEEIIAAKIALPLQYFENSPIKRGYILLPDFEKLGENEINRYFSECLSNASREDA